MRAGVTLGNSPNKAWNSAKRRRCQAPKFIAPAYRFIDPNSLIESAAVVQGLRIGGTSVALVQKSA
jgi:hypothetical protein